MKKRTPISKIMSTSLITISVSKSLKDAFHLLNEKRIRHIPVMSGEQLVGILSKTDLDKASFINTYDQEDLNMAIFENLTIEQVMTKHLKTVQESDTIHDVAVVLTKNEFHALPVLNGKELVGIVTTTDLIKYLIDLY